MKIFCKIVFFLSVSLFLSSVEAQVTIFSPYTRFAIGDINQSGFGLNRALGGTAVGIRFNNDINYLNPASYSARDTLSFIFDFGLNGSLRKISTSTDEAKFKEVNFGHLAISFPVTKWWGAAIGILPYSKVGYKMTVRKPFLNVENESSEIIYEGSGGLNQFFIGSGFRIGEYISIGGNLSYIFGRINHNRTVNVINSQSGGMRAGTASSVFIDEMTISNVMYSFGLQAFKNFGMNSRIVAGLTFDNKTVLKGDIYSATTAGYVLPTGTADTIKGNAELPARLGLGLSYTYKNKLTFAFDYIYQDWSSSTFFGKSDSLTTSNSFRFGIQYAPVALTEVRRAEYWKRINLRIGGYYNNTYLQINGNQVKDYGMTFGLGIPWKNEKNMLTNTTFNISYQIGQRGSIENGMVKDNYQIFSLGLTMYDFWFIKPKYD